MLPSMRLLLARGRVHAHFIRFFWNFSSTLPYFLEVRTCFLGVSTYVVFEYVYVCSFFLFFSTSKGSFETDFLTTLRVLLPSMRLGQALGRVLGVALSPPFGVEITL